MSATKTARITDAILFLFRMNQHEENQCHGKKVTTRELWKKDRTPANLGSYIIFTALVE
jgi:hypothetical protein